MAGELCDKCGAHRKNYRETMGEDCGCEVDSPEYITKVVKQLFRKDELTTLELEGQIKGEG